MSEMSFDYAQDDKLKDLAALSASWFSAPVEMSEMPFDYAQDHIMFMLYDHTG